MYICIYTVFLYSDECESFVISNRFHVIFWQAYYTAFYGVSMGTINKTLKHFKHMANGRYTVKRHAVGIVRYACVA